MRDYILFYVNGKRHTVTGKHAFATLSDYLRYDCGLTGTKVVCAEGDCAACTVLRAFPEDGPLQFESVNSCITLTNLMDCSHLITVEGLRDSKGALSEVQKSMVKHQGGQCGFCTPGFVMAITSLYENTDTKVDEKKAKNYLTGNLCRCTGYEPILKAALSVDPSKIQKIKTRYQSKEIEEDLRKHRNIPVKIQNSGRYFSSPVDLKNAAKEKSENTKIFSSATDLGVQINKGKYELKNLMSLNLVSELYEISEKNNEISIGAKVSLTKVQNFLKDKVPVFDEFLNIFASPQIKNIATLAGNIANASPIADTPPFLFAVDAKIELVGPKGKRLVEISKFYKAYKKTEMKPDEFISRIIFKRPEKNNIFKLYKSSQRRDLDISCVNAGFRLSLKGKEIEDARLAFGGVGPVILRLEKIENFLKGKTVSQETFDGAAALVKDEISPLSDVRGTKEFRLKLSENLFRKFYHDIQTEGLAK